MRRGAGVGKIIFFVCVLPNFLRGMFRRAEDSALRARAPHNRRGHVKKIPRHVPETKATLHASARATSVSSRRRNSTE